MQAAPLWGYDPFAKPYELSVLLDIDLGTKTLYMASLVAIDWGSDDKGREIYYEEEIQPLAMTGFDDPGRDEGPGRPGPDSGPRLDDDFKDLLGGGEGVAGSDPRVAQAGAAAFTDRGVPMGAAIFGDRLRQARILRQKKAD